MASQVPPVNAAEFIFYWALTSQADTKLIQVNPTLAAGDVLVSKDGGATANLNTLPTVTPAGGPFIKITVSASEMTADNTNLYFHDVAGAEWCDTVINVQSVARLFNALAFSNAQNAIEVSAGGGVAPDWANIKSPTTTNNLSGTTVKTATDIATQITALNNLSSSDVTTIISAALTATVANSLPADGSRPSIASGILWLTRFLGERSVSGLTMTVNNETGTPSMTFTLNDSANPTSITRTS